MKLKDVLPANAARVLENLSIDEYDRLTDIRLRVERPIYFYIDGIEYSVKNGNLTKFDGEVFSVQNAAEMWRKLCEGAPYSKLENQNHGYITVDGNRIGFSGSFNDGNGKMIIEDVFSFCIRIAHQKKGCAKKIEDFVLDSFPKSTLIISPPGCGKTTMLRDIVRLSSENGFNSCVIDQRGEIANAVNGVPTFDIGKRSDVVVSKNRMLAIENSIRSLKPDIVAVDEIGIDDIKPINMANEMGVSVFATIHAKSLAEALNRIENKFDVYVLLDKIPKVGTVKKIYSKDGEQLC